ncbi:uncharacterized protein LY89DRAFT_738175 [Mollisia scopiformis]|uniref:Uncharacterized protein n=1 Tax=Mollisia scopiformis TaxID=149040 RepID=A0A194WXH2_MOLSC|nr:uncharacterized protein LY89DRAFT_738175 [Mollisia scopiformis]KUJ12678.1 hypothetical protein LY89DRAFT_738175 [Mollisia scopiformis]
MAHVWLDNIEVLIDAIQMVEAEKETIEKYKQEHATSMKQLGVRMKLIKASAEVFDQLEPNMFEDWQDLAFRMNGFVNTFNDIIVKNSSDRMAFHARNQMADIELEVLRRGHLLKKNKLDLDRMHAAEAEAEALSEENKNLRKSTFNEAIREGAARMRTQRDLRLHKSQGV